MVVRRAQQDFFKRVFFALIIVAVHQNTTSDDARFSSVQHARPQEEFPEVDGQLSRQSQQAHGDAT